MPPARMHNQGKQFSQGDLERSHMCRGKCIQRAVQGRTKMHAACNDNSDHRTTAALTMFDGNRTKKQNCLKKDLERKYQERWRGERAWERQRWLLLSEAWLK